MREGSPSPPGSQPESGGEEPRATTSPKQVLELSHKRSQFDTSLFHLMCIFCRRSRRKLQKQLKMMFHQLPIPEVPQSMFLLAVNLNIIVCSSDRRKKTKTRRED